LFVASIFKAVAEIQTTAENVSIDLKEKTVILSGGAQVKRDDGLTFLSQEITVIWQDWKCNKPKSITARGKVCFEFDGKIVTADSCEYDMEVIKFVGNVTITSGELGVMKADVAIYNLKSKKICISSTGEKKVTLMINQNGFKGS
jgi:lipopolysaccharide export system protein LptA